jgi:phytoene dehydrogenase-like protein
MPVREIPAECDVAIIGAGVGGLTAGALLAKAGMRVVVLEREVRVGGYLAGFKRKHFIFDTAIHWLNQCGPGGLVHTVFSHLGPDFPTAPPLRRIRRYKGDTFDYTLTDDPEALKSRLKADFPAESDGIDRFFAEGKVLGERMFRLATVMRTGETLTLWEKMTRGLRMAVWSRPFWRYLGDRDCKKLRTFFRDPKLRAIFCTEENILSCLVPVGWAYWGDYQQPPAGGSQAFPQWLTRFIETRGGSVLTRTTVDQVLVEDNRAVGVRVGDRSLRAKWVIGACDVETLLSRMMPPGVVADRAVTKYRDAELYSSCVTLSIGLDCSPADLGFDEELIFLTSDGLPRKAYNDGDPHTAGLSILAPSLRDPTLAPPGKGTLTIYASAYLDYGDRWKTGPGLERGPEYEAFKAKYADVLIERVERALAPGLRQHIEILDIATPITHLRYTGNKNGTIMGQLANRRNMKLRAAGYRTPVRNLLIGGHWAEYGGGVPMAVRAGANAALLIMQRDNPAGFAELRDVLDGKAVPALLPASAQPASTMR